MLRCCVVGSSVRAGHRRLVVNGSSYSPSCSLAAYGKTVDISNAWLGRREEDFNCAELVRRSSMQQGFGVLNPLYY